MQGTVIFIEDEEEVRTSVAQTLELEGYGVRAFDDGISALNDIDDAFSGVVVTDLRMPGMDGLQVLQRIMDIDGDVPVIVFTGHGDIPAAVEAMRVGAYDFVEKTADPDRLLLAVGRALEKRTLVLENRRLLRRLEGAGDLDRRLIGRSDEMERVRAEVRSLADLDVDVLIFGETGTGKEVVARCLHDFSPRADAPFVAVNCGALAESVLESELFGHEAGAFTGAAKRRIGKIEHAHGGTLFLDEIESMPLAAQVRLLRVLQERSFERVGGNDPIEVDIRVLAASKVDLVKAAEGGTFREDLVYRLRVAEVHLPSLKERLEDIPILFNAFVATARERYGRHVPDPSSADLDALAEKPWSGNVRELKNAADRYVLGLVDRKAPGAAVRDADLASRVAEFERRTIVECLRDKQGRISETAHTLGIPRKTLYLRMRKYDLKREDYM